MIKCLHYRPSYFWTYYIYESPDKVGTLVSIGNHDWQFQVSISMFKHHLSKILNRFLHCVDIMVSMSKLWIPSLKLPLQLLSPPPPGAWGQQQWDNNDPSTFIHCCCFFGLALVIVQWWLSPSCVNFFVWLFVPGIVETTSNICYKLSTVTFSFIFYTIDRVLATYS